MTGGGAALANDLFYFLRKNGVDLLRYLPPFLAKDATFKDVEDTLSREHESYRLRLVDLAKQFFIETATWSLPDWENFVGVTPLSDDIEARRARVRAKLLGSDVMTVANTNKLIRTFTDGDGAFVDESGDPNVVKIILPDRVLYWRELVETLLERMPAHLGFGLERRQDYFVGDGYGGGIFAGIAEARVGTKTFDIAHPSDQLARIYSGVVVREVGEKIISLTKPKILFGNEHKFFVGQVLIKGGELIIDADPRDIPDRSWIRESGIADLLIADFGIARPGRITLPVETYEETLKLPLNFGVGMKFEGNKDFNLTKPHDEKISLHAGTALFRQGNVTIKPDTTYKVSQSVTMRAGVALIKSGLMIIGTEDKPTVPPGMIYRGFSSTLRLNSGVGLTKIGTQKIYPSPQKYHSLNKIIMRAGVALIKAGEMTIYPAPELEFDEAIPEGEFLRLYWNFPTGRDKPVLLKNFRDDLIVADIKSLSDDAVDQKIFLNDKAESTLGIDRVDLINGFAVDSADALTTLPSSDQIRLFFDFAEGNDHKIMLHNVRQGITLKELHELGEQAADEKLLTNSKNEVTTGISRVAVVKKIKISDSNSTDAVKF